MKPIDLVNPASSNKVLDDLMNRVGVNMEPREFVRLVSNTYHKCGVEQYNSERHELFKKSGSHNDLRNAYTLALNVIKKDKLDILNIGCGSGYEASVFVEAIGWNRAGRMVLTDISPEMLLHAWGNLRGVAERIDFRTGWADQVLQKDELFDLVITHSLVHHIAELGSFFQLIEDHLKADALYVMAHEPSVRYFKNAECSKIHDRMRMFLKLDYQRRRFFSLQVWSDRLSRLFRSRTNRQSLEQNVNDELRGKHRFKSDLSPREISKLVDIHCPCIEPGEFSIGYDGFDWDVLHATYLRDFKIIKVATSDYMGAEILTPFPADFKNGTSGSLKSTRSTAVILQPFSRNPRAIATSDILSPVWKLNC